MSTRANIKIVDGKDELWFYRHSDGYPEGTMPTLNKFLNLLKEGKIRNNLSQSAGWLILIGAEEYGIDIKNVKDWKVGAYEPTTRQHGDIAYLYIIDLEKKTIEIEEVM